MDDGTQDDYPLDEVVTEFPVETFELPNNEVKVSQEIEAAPEVEVKNQRGRRKKPGKGKRTRDR